MYRILLVEDDPGIAQAVCAHLRQWELDARCVQNFRAVMEEFTAFDPQLVLLDISLPFFNGYHWCTQIRAVSRVPVVFLSSASENMNIVMAMNMGADDFIAKPFDLDVLTAKVQALLRRTYDFAPAEPVLSHRGAVLQTGDQSLLVNGEKLPLSKNEYRILWTLLKEKGKIVSRERLMEALWQTDSFVDENTLSVNMARLRKKLDGAGLAGFIATRVGAGYLVERGCGHFYSICAEKRGRSSRFSCSRSFLSSRLRCTTCRWLRCGIRRRCVSFWGLRFCCWISGGSKRGMRRCG